MNAQSTRAEHRSVPSAGAVLPWCVLAAALVSALLLYEPSSRGKLEFWGPGGALALLVDLTLCYVLFILPVFARRRPVLSGTVEPVVLVLFTSAAGLVMLDRIVDLPGGALWRVIGFVVLASAAGTVWARALERRPSVYFPAAALVGFGLALAGFFCRDLFGIEATWLDWLSPFTAWRTLAQDAPASWTAWGVFGVLVVSGAAVLLVRKRGGPK